MDKLPAVCVPDQILTRYIIGHFRQILEGALPHLYGLLKKTNKNLIRQSLVALLHGDSTRL